VADDHIWLGGGFSSGLRSDKTCDQSCKRDRVSGDERDNALPQWPLRECRGHNRSPDPLSITNNLAVKTFPSQWENRS
jgi:hypothetical protein